MMASRFEKGKHIFFLFKNGYTVQDSQLKPRCYLERIRAEMYLPYGDEIVEYAPAVHSKWNIINQTAARGWTERNRSMTVEKLEQYRALADEISDLEQRRRKAARRANIIVSDTVRGSSDAWPYGARTVRITGVAARHVRSIQRIDLLRRRRQMAAKALLSEIEAFLGTIGDARIRRMIEMHYIQGQTWRQVAGRVYGSPAYEDAARKATKRFLEKE